MPIILLSNQIRANAIIHVHCTRFDLLVRYHIAGLELLVIVLHRLPNNGLSNVDVAHVLQIFGVVQW
jgi:hypothetical protein